MGFGIAATTAAVAAKMSVEVVSATPTTLEFVGAEVTMAPGVAPM